MYRKVHNIDYVHSCTRVCVRRCVLYTSVCVKVFCPCDEMVSVCVVVHLPCGSGNVSKKVFP